MPGIFRKLVNAGRCVASAVFLPAVGRGRKFAPFVLAVMLSALPCLGTLAEQETQRVSFIARRDFRVGSSPVSVAVGDFNGDGVADVAVANANSNNVSVLLGNGDGTFQAAQNFAAGSGPQSVAVGDFNGDGVADLVVANVFSNSVSVLLGNGDGTFQAAQNFAVGILPRSVTVGDFNGDGIQDLAVANQSSNDVSVLLGNGDGTFQAAQAFGTGPGLNIPRSCFARRTSPGVQRQSVCPRQSRDETVHLAIERQLREQLAPVRFECRGCACSVHEQGQNPGKREQLARAIFLCFLGFRCMGLYRV